MNLSTFPGFILPDVAESYVELAVRRQEEQRWMQTPHCDGWRFVMQVKAKARGGGKSSDYGVSFPSMRHWH